MLSTAELQLSISLEECRALTGLLLGTPGFTSALAGLLARLQELLVVHDPVQDCQASPRLDRPQQDQGTFVASLFDYHSPETS